jgi:hypothetical protein
MQEFGQRPVRLSDLTIGFYSTGPSRVLAGFKRNRIEDFYASQYERWEESGH